jgi:hypothetical protein
MVEMVTVHNFRRYNILTDGFDVSKHKATAEAIKRFSSEIIDGTAEQVDRSALDDLGRYKPKS